MSPEFYTIIGGAMALAGLVINSHRSLSASLAQMRTQQREDIGELRKDFGALSERVARLEGLIEGLRDAVTGKAA